MVGYQGHWEFPFGNSRESDIPKIPGGNSHGNFENSVLDLSKVAVIKTHFPSFLADRTNATVLRPTVVCRR